MIVKLKSFECIHLDSLYCLASLQNTLTFLVLFSLIDAHGYFSLNDVQFWAFMNSVTDLDEETISRYFFRLDYDYNGELNFTEFYLLCCCMIAAKDGVTKEFALRHIKVLWDILDKGNHKYLSINEFCQMGGLMGWNRSSVDQLYKAWGRNVEKENRRIKAEGIKFFIICLIDHEKSLKASRRVKAVQEFKRQWLYRLKDVILDYIYFRALPPPSKVWLILTSNRDLPTVERGKGIREERGFFLNCVLWMGLFLILPWWIVYKILGFLWKLTFCRWFIRFIWRVVTGQCCFYCCIGCCKKCRPKETTNKFHPDPYLYDYYRNKIMRDELEEFHYLGSQKNMMGILGKIEPWQWQDPWLRKQLHLEALERQLLRNRYEMRKKEGRTYKDILGLNEYYRKIYVDGDLNAKYSDYVDAPFPSEPSDKSQLPIDRDNLLGSEHLSTFLKYFTAQEIILAEQQVRAQEIDKTKTARPKILGKIRANRGLNRERRYEFLRKKCGEEEAKILMENLQEDYELPRPETCRKNKLRNDPAKHARYIASRFMDIKLKKINKQKELSKDHEILLTITGGKPLATPQIEYPIEKEREDRVKARLDQEDLEERKWTGRRLKKKKVRKVFKAGKKENENKKDTHAMGDHGEELMIGNQKTEKKGTTNQKKVVELQKKKEEVGIKPIIKSKSMKQRKLSKEKPKKVAFADPSQQSAEASSSSLQRRHFSRRQRKTIENDEVKKVVKKLKN